MTDSDWQSTPEMLAAKLEAAESGPAMVYARGYHAGEKSAAAEVDRLRQELAEARAAVINLRERRESAVRAMVEAETIVGAIWHALGLSDDSGLNIVAEVRALVARDKPGCSKAHEELSTVEAERDRLLADNTAKDKIIEAWRPVVEATRAYVLDEDPRNDQFEAIVHSIGRMPFEYLNLADPLRIPPDSYTTRGDT